MALKFSENGKAAVKLVAVTKEGLENWLRGLPETARSWAKSAGFCASAGSALAFPDAKGGIAMAAVGLGDETARRRIRFLVGAARAKLPKADYALQGIEPGAELDEAALGWLLAGYRFDRYADVNPPQARLVAPDGVDAARLETVAAAEALTRDLINTPAADMGPEQLEDAAQNLAEWVGAQMQVIRGDDLLAQNFPMIHAVGRASERAPRLIDMTWGPRGPN